MARIDFPSNPSNGQTLTVNVAGANTVYTYNSTYGVWRSKGTATTISSGGGASVTTSNTTPPSPSSGSLWWNSMDGVALDVVTEAPPPEEIVVAVPFDLHTPYVLF